MGGCGAASFVSFLFFKETFRTERSLAWQKARKSALERVAAGEEEKESDTKPNILIRWYRSIKATLGRSKSRFSTQKKAMEEMSTTEQSSKGSDTPFAPPLYLDTPHSVSRTTSAPTNGTIAEMTKSIKLDRSVSARPAATRPPLARRITTKRSISRVVTSNGKEIKFRPSISDVSPLGSAVAVLKQPHNIITIGYSGVSVCLSLLQALITKHHMVSACLCIYILTLIYSF
jgi:hypothetical protein